MDFPDGVGGLLWRPHSDDEESRKLPLLKHAYRYHMLRVYLHNFSSKSYASTLVHQGSEMVRKMDACVLDQRRGSRHQVMGLCKSCRRNFN
jgi:hypothetical protein